MPTRTVKFLNRVMQERTLTGVSAPIHVDGIRIGHIHQERDVRVNRRESTPEVGWSKVGRINGVSVREGQGRSGLVYRLVRKGSWQVTVHGGHGSVVEVGSARMQDHAMALASLWEQGVSSGRIDVG